MACGILVTGPGIGPLHWNMHSLPLDFQGSPNRIETLKHQSEFYLVFLLGVWGRGVNKRHVVCFVFLFFGHATEHARSWFPNQGSNPCPLQWKLDVLTTGLPGKSQECVIYEGVFYLLSLQVTATPCPCPMGARPSASSTPSSAYLSPFCS